MSEETVAKQVREELEEMAERIFVRSARRIYVDVPPERSVEANRVMFEKLGGRLATATGLDTRDCVEMLYHYAVDREGVVVTIRTRAMKPDLELPSVATILPAADWIEREVKEMLGVTFIGHPDPRRLLLADDWPEGVYPLRRDFPAKMREPVPASEEAHEPVRSDQS